MLDGMPKPKHARLDAAWGLLAENPVLLVIAGIGFFVSFQTIARAATEQHMPGWPVLYPLLIDAAILGFIIEARKAIDDGRSDLVPRALAWAGAAFTIYVNAHGSPARDWLGITLHVAAPCMWIAFLELTRWRKLHRTASDRIPLARWLAAPWPTFKLWRRMKLSNVTSYALAVKLEDARLKARDLVRAARDAEPAPLVPASLRRDIRSGRLPAAVTDGIDMGFAQGIEEAVKKWVTGSLTLAEDVSAALASRRQEIAQAATESPSQASPEPVAEAASQTAAQTRPRPPVQPGARKPSKAAVRRMTGEQLAEYVRPLLDATPDLTKTGVMDALHCGREKAETALKLAQDARRKDLMTGVPVSARS